MSILLADDDVQLANFLSRSLESEGYAVHTALDEETVLAELKRQNYKLIILDLNFGQTDGLQLLERLRSQGLETPVMVLSARNHVADRIQSLNSGADDYITKPFSFQELAARANALLRRKTDPSLNVLRVDDLDLDPATRKVRRSNRDIKLTPKEFDMLHLLLRHAGETVHRNHLLSECWGSESGTDSNLVDVYVNYLRKKVDAPGEDKLIQTVRGAGYRLGRPANVGSTNRVLYDFGNPGVSHSYPAASFGDTASSALQQSPLRALVYSAAHDLAQPLTSVRCFLEVLAMRKGSIADHAADIKVIEQQADRAIALAKGISGMVRESPVAAGPWTSLDGLLNDVFNDFATLLHSGLLTLHRQWDSTIQVTSSPVLRQLLILALSKLTGRNTGFLDLTVSAKMLDGRCHLEFRWKSAEGGSAGILDFSDMFAKELVHVEEMVHSIGGELGFHDVEPMMTFKLPTMVQASAVKPGVMQ